METRLIKVFHLMNIDYMQCDLKKYFDFTTSNFIQFENPLG